MNKRKILAEEKKAMNAIDTLNSHCETIAFELQKYFDEEISVFWNPSDGIIVIHNGERYGEILDSFNTPVCEVVRMIELDADAFR